MNLDAGGDAGPVNTGQNNASCTGATPGAGQFKGRYRVGGEVALFDAKGGSNISGADFAHAIVEEIDNRPAAAHIIDEAGPGGHARGQVATRQTRDFRRRIGSGPSRTWADSQRLKSSLFRLSRLPLHDMFPGEYAAKFRSSPYCRR